MMRYPKPTHVYIGRTSCGCCVALRSDTGDAATAKSVAEFIEEGLTVNRVSWINYTEGVSQEEGFMDCKHGRDQLELFGK